MTGVEELRSDGVYFVRRDINVRPGGRLKVTPGVTLKFEHSIGMMVAGELIAEGDLQGGQPLFTLLDSPRDNLTDVTVRLVGGKNIREGRLQVYKDDQWGTVCNFGWTIESAALACQQMGWVLNPEDWDLMPSEIPGLFTIKHKIYSVISSLFTFLSNQLFTFLSNLLFVYISQ